MAPSPVVGPCAAVLVLDVVAFRARRVVVRRPFRFLLNNSKATATNVYLCLYPKPLLAKELARDPAALRPLWKALNAVDRETLLGNGRVYGGGMHKLEPKELANVPADELAAVVGLGKKTPALQLELEEVFAA